MQLFLDGFAQLFQRFKRAFQLGQLIIQRWQIAAAYVQYVDGKGRFTTSQLFLFKLFGEGDGEGFFIASSHAYDVVYKRFAPKDLFAFHDHLDALGVEDDVIF